MKAGITSNTDNHSIVAIFDSHIGAEAALKALQNAGLDMRLVSVVAKDFYSEEQAVGLFTSGDQIKFWGVRGRFWGSLWGMLSGGAFLFIPTIGPLVAMGPLVAGIVRVLEADALGSATGALGGALRSVGISDDGVSNYETAVKLGKFMVLARGDLDVLLGARAVLSASGAAQLSANDP